MNAKMNAKWKRLWAGWLTMALMVMIAAGCALTNAGAPEEPDPDPAGSITESDLSPVPEQPPAKIKETVTLYFADRDLMDMFRVEREIEAEHQEDLPKAALESWMEGPTPDEQEGLTNLAPPDVVIEKIEYKDDMAYISFSKEIRNANLGSGGEMFLIEQIALIMQQFGYTATQILVEGEIEESILGHVTTNEPIPAPDPEQYQWYGK